jgi:DNA invertase Pin-like site-specific DNA recombinase
MTETPPPIPVVVLGVRSQDEEPGKDSAGDQVRIAREAALREPGRFVYSEHVDHGSGFRGNRGKDAQEAMDNARQAVAEHGRAELWVFKSERLGRGSGRKDEARSVLEVYVDMRRAGVDLRSAEDDAYFTNPMLVGVADEMAHKYAKDLSAHVRRGLAERKRAGKPVGPIPLGFTSTFVLDEHGKVVQDTKGKPITERIIDLVAGPLVERIFWLIERGATYGDVARTLNAEGIRTRPRGKAKNGSAWTSATVREIVLNSAYAGEKGYPVLIDPDRWHAIVGRLNGMGKTPPKRRQGGRKLVDPAYFLRGIALCGKCGASLYTREQALGPKLPKEPGQRRASRKQIRVYVCRNRREGTRLCDAPAIPAALIEDHVLRHLDSFVDSAGEWINQQIALREGEHRARHDALDTHRAGLAALDQERECHFAAYRAMIADEDPLARYALEEVAHIDQDRTAQEKTIADAEAVISEWASPPDIDAALDFYTDLLTAVHRRVAQAVGVRELNQALSTVVAGLWAEIEVGRERLLVEFELLHPTKQVLPGGAPVMLPTRPSLPPRRLDDVHTSQPPAITFLNTAPCRANTGRGLAIPPLMVEVTA